MAVKMNATLKELLMAINLGLSRDHPLAGWQILTILYHDGAGNEALTEDTLVKRYNGGYLDQESNEAPLSDAVLKKVLDVLESQARFIEVSSRKVRIQMKNGGKHIQSSRVYKITSSGIEYLSMMRRVMDAENTVTANINRIDEYCQLVQRLAEPNLSTASTALFNDFNKMITAYTDVMKGMHKLDDDLSELTDELSFNHGGQAAQHLQGMLTDKAIPAFKKLLAQGPLINELAHKPSFWEQVASSQQGQDDLDTAHAVGDQSAMYQRFNKMRNYVQRQLGVLEASFNPSTEAIDTSMDTVYLLFQTILDAVQLLSREYDHIQSQTVDLKALTANLDQLLVRYKDLVIPGKIPRHLAQDRQVTNPHDLLVAGSMDPVTYTFNQQTTTVATVEDNPVIVSDEVDDDTDITSGLKEFKDLVYRDGRVVVDHDLAFQTLVARDEVVQLYRATGYEQYTAIPFLGLTIKNIQILTTQRPIKLHYVKEDYSVWLPSGFIVEFARQGEVDE